MADWSGWARPEAEGDNSPEDSDADATHVTGAESDDADATRVSRPDDRPPPPPPSLDKPPTGPAAPAPPRRWGAPEPARWDSPDSGPASPPGATGPAAPTGAGGLPRWEGDSGYVRAPKPGIIPLRPLAIGEILDGAFTNMRQNPGATFGLAAIVTTVVGVLTFLVRLADQNASDGVAGLVSILTSIVTFTAQSALAGMLLVVVSEAVLGTKIRLSDAYARVRPRIPGLVGVSLLLILFTFLGLIAVIIGAVYVAVALCLSAPAYTLEGVTVRGALKRSRTLIHDAWWRTFGILVLVWIVTAFLQVVLEVPFVLGAGGGSLFDASGHFSTGALLLLTIGQIVAGTITMPFAAGSLALIYVDRRIRSEGLDVTLAQAARERAGE